MNALDYTVLLVAILGIAVYGTWRTRGRRSLNTYLKGTGDTPWFVIGVSVTIACAKADGAVNANTADIRISIANFLR